jgi:GTP-binding protein
MALPVVAIVGRPNVGKSSLFNWLAGRRISIVDPTAGVTRDRVNTVVEAGDRFFELVDTGGMGIVDSDNLTEDVENQISHAIDAAAIVLFVVDVREGTTPLDQTVAERLHGLGKPVLFLANKADDPKLDSGTGDFYRLGFGEALPVSANNGRHRDLVLDKILAALPADTGEAPPGLADLKLAIVGRRNAGKSTFVNQLAKEDRVIVSEVPGTTRDSVDVRIERDGKSLLVIDTAGVRKRSTLANDIEFYGLHRAQRSIRRADVVLHFFDSRIRIGRVDKQLAEYILEEHKPAIFVFNKWDLVKNAMTTEKMGEYVRKIFRVLDYVPIAFVTAKSGKNSMRLLHLATELHKQAGERVSTGTLNRLIRDAMNATPPPTRMGNRQAKVFYVSQVATQPPTVAFVVNEPDLFDETYLRYLTKTLRDHGPFAEVPIKIILKPRNQAGARGLGAGAEAEAEARAETAEGDVETPTTPKPAARKPAARKAVVKPKKKKKPSVPKTWNV